MHHGHAVIRIRTTSPDWIENCCWESETGDGDLHIVNEMSLTMSDRHDHQSCHHQVRLISVMVVYGGMVFAGCSWIMKGRVFGHNRASTLLGLLIQTVIRRAGVTAAQATADAEQQLPVR